MLSSLFRMAAKIYFEQRISKPTGLLRKDSSKSQQGTSQHSLRNQHSVHSSVYPSNPNQKRKEKQALAHTPSKVPISRDKTPLLNNGSESGKGHLNCHVANRHVVVVAFRFRCRPRVQLVARRALPAQFDRSFLGALSLLCLRYKHARSQQSG